jgi:hypothetical protein
LKEENGQCYFHNNKKNMKLVSVLGHSTDIFTFHSFGGWKFQDQGADSISGTALLSGSHRATVFAVSS